MRRQSGIQWTVLYADVLHRSLRGLWGLLLSGLILPFFKFIKSMGYLSYLCALEHLVKVYYSLFRNVRFFFFFGREFLSARLLNMTLSIFSLCFILTNASKNT